MKMARIGVFEILQSSEMQIFSLAILENRSNRITDKRTDFMYLHTNFKPQKTGFSPVENTFQNFFDLFTFILCNFSVQTLKYFQKKF